MLSIPVPNAIMKRERVSFERRFLYITANKAGVQQLTQVATITLKKGSAVTSVTLDDVVEQLNHYREQLKKTGEQLGWQYETAAFPYDMEKGEGDDPWLYLKGSGRYRRIVIGAGSRQQTAASEADGEEAPETESFVQIVLPEDSTFADKCKGNELCKYLGKAWKAEVKMFNGRTIYYNPRK